MQETRSYNLTTPRDLWEQYKRTVPRGRGINLNDALVGTISKEVLELRGDDLAAATRDDLQELIVRDRDDHGGDDVR